MQQLKHVLAVVVPLIVAGTSSLAVSPAAQTFIEKHPGDAAYVLLVAGVLRAVYKAFTGESAAEAPPEDSGPGSATMGAK